MPPTRRLLAALLAGTSVTHGQALVADLYPGTWNSVRQFTPLLSAPTAALFRDFEGIVWRSDGTPAGTGAAFDHVLSLRTTTAAATAFGYLVGGCPGQHTLWRTDGSAGGTVSIGMFGSVDLMVGLPTRVVLIATAVGGTTPELWAVEPDAVTITRLGVSLGGTPTQMTAAHGRAYFLVNGNLWLTDGTIAGTQQVLGGIGATSLFATSRGIAMGALRVGSRPLLHWDISGALTTLTIQLERVLGTTGSHVVFTEPGGPNTRVLAGDALGVNLVHSSGVVTSFAASAGDVYFMVPRGQTVDLMATDGAAAVTVAQFTQPQLAGTDGGTVLVNETAPGLAALHAVDRRMNQRLISGAQGSALAISPLGTLVQVIDGRGATINLLRNGQLTPLRTLAASAPRTSLPLRNASGRPHVASRAGQALIMVGAQTPGIWRTDGTTAGTYQLMAAANCEVVATPRRFYFSTATKLYESDGTVAGTALLLDGAPNSFGNLLADGDGVVAVFTRSGADDLVQVAPDRTTRNLPLTRTPRTIGSLCRGDLGLYVALTDGRDAVIERIRPNATASEVVAVLPNVTTPPLLFGSLAGSLVIASGGVFALRESDGQLAPLGAAQPNAAAVGSGMIFLFLGTEVWRTDGTAAGTFRLGSTNLARSHAMAGNRLFFVGVDAMGEEPWLSDGTLAGTTRIADLNPGPCSSSPSDFTALGDSAHVAFAANTPQGGMQLWRSDGTASGTQLLGRVRAVGSSRPIQPIALGRRVLAWADDGVHGFEPWSFDAAVSGAHRTQVLSGSCQQSIAALTTPRVGSAGFGLTAPRTNAPSVCLLGTHGVTTALPGLSTCELRTGDLFATLLPQSSGAAQTVALPLPAQSALVGTTLVGQFADTNLRLSDALWVLIGR